MANIDEYLSTNRPKRGDFPNQLIFLKDLGVTQRWNGTAWAFDGASPGAPVADSVQTLIIPFTIWVGPTSSGKYSVNSDALCAPLLDNTPLRIVEIAVTTLVATTNDGTHFWTGTLSKIDNAGSATVMGTFDTSADTADVQTPHLVKASALTLTATGPSDAALLLAVAKTSTPGVLAIAAHAYVQRLPL
jgi:hypothetical protein